MGLLNFARLGSLLGQPIASMAGIPGEEVGRGSSLIAANVTSTFDSELIPDGETLLLSFPTQRDTATGTMFSASINAAPGASTAHFAVNTDPVTPDLQRFQVRTGFNYGSRTFDWAWYKVETS